MAVSEKAELYGADAKESLEERGFLCKDSYVNYSSYGVCRISDIRFMKFDSGRPERQYYILKPVHSEGESIFVPMDNRRQVEKMRPILSAEEIEKIILSIKNKKMTWIDDRKQRAARFQDILSRRDERELLLFVSCLYLHDRESIKGISSSDKEVLKKSGKDNRKRICLFPKDRYAGHRRIYKKQIKIRFLIL